MKTFNITLRSAIAAVAVVFSTFTTQLYATTSASTLIDNFETPSTNNLGFERQFLDDTMAGGATQFDASVATGILNLSGEIVPPRGQPGWASTVLPFAQLGGHIDASEHTGIKLRIKINAGTFSLSANSLDITNFDYHAAPITVANDGKFHDVSIPFESMKRAWSPQVDLNTANLGSLSIVAFGLQPTAFAAEIAEVSFY